MKLFQYMNTRPLYILLLFSYFLDMNWRYHYKSKISTW